MLKSYGVVVMLNEDSLDDELAMVLSLGRSDRAADHTIRIVEIILANDEEVSPLQLRQVREILETDATVRLVRIARIMGVHRNTLHKWAANPHHPLRKAPTLSGTAYLYMDSVIKTYQQLQQFTKH